MGATLLHPLGPLIAVSCLQTVLLVRAVCFGPSNLDVGIILLPSIWLFLLPIWAGLDAYRRRCTPCFDFTFFCYLFMPIAIPWYCLRTRGWKGLLFLCGLFALWVAPYVIAAMAMTIAVLG